MSPSRDVPLRSRISPLYSILLFLTFPFMMLLPCRSSASADEADACLGCHGSPGMSMTLGDKSTLSVFVNSKELASSVHGKQGCTGCHADVDLNKHPSKSYASKKAFSDQQSKSCRNCHGDDRLFANPLHKRVLAREQAPACPSFHGSHAVRKAAQRTGRSSTTEYCLACHSQPLTKSVNGEMLSLTIDQIWLQESVHRNHECTDCHTAYSKAVHPLPKDLKSLRELSHAASETCSRCHLDKAVKVKDSIHAALLAAGEQKAPGCSDCHGAHRIGRGALEDTVAGNPCRKCHANIYDAYRTSVHGMNRMSEKTSGPLCAGCHQAHDVKPAMASRSPRSMCLGCHRNFENDHRQWLPNPQAHLEMVACTACHVPLAYKRSIYLRMTDGATGKLLSEQDVLAALGTGAGKIGNVAPKDLWTAYRDLSAKRTVQVSVAVSMNERLNAHYLLPKIKAVRLCEECHAADSSFFQTAAVAMSGPDGREKLLAVDPKVLSSAYGVVFLKRFYVMSGTRITAMDYAGLALVLGGIAVPVVHGSLMALTAKRRKEKKQAS